MTPDPAPAPRVALVTGGASGIGEATAELLSASGVTVVVADLATGIDVTDPAAVDEMVATTVERHGRLDIAVNSAGVSGAYANTADQEVDEWRRVIDVNLTSVFLSVRAELRQMLAQDPAGGVIVNVASAAGSMGVPGLSHYSASKHGVIGLTKSAALEYARQDVRINAVLPGTVHTPMLERFAGSAEAVAKMGRITPLGRAATPTEIAQAILWLTTPAASYVTGACFPIDGGALAT